jgi:dihydroxy-acid dehydratase
VVGHITPEAFEGGLIALVEDDDIIELSVATKTMTLKVDEAIIAQRRANWKQPKSESNKRTFIQIRKAGNECC